MNVRGLISYFEGEKASTEGQNDGFGESSREGQRDSHGESLSLNTALYGQTKYRYISLSRALYLWSRGTIGENMSRDKKTSLCTNHDSQVMLPVDAVPTER